MFTIALVIFMKGICVWKYCVKEGNYARIVPIRMLTGIPAKPRIFLMEEKAFRFLCQRKTLIPNSTLLELSGSFGSAVPALETWW